ncbi:MAG TPA: hypothetical protein VGE74_22265 [Gemmata sp.]
MWHKREKRRRRTDPVAAPLVAPLPVAPPPRYAPTETDWQGGEPGAMLRALVHLATNPGIVSHLPRAAIVRKLRLFHCACCRLRWDLLPAIGRAAVEVVEQYADGFVNAKRLRGARRAAGTVARAAHPPWNATTVPGAWDVTNVARLAVAAAEVHATLALGRATSGPSVSAPDQSRLLRELFENPFRPVRIAPGWHTPTVVALARAAHADRAFELMPVLGDALQDAGCSSPEVLDHCYGPGPHVSGCWLLDRLTGRVGA